MSKFLTFLLVIILFIATGVSTAVNVLFILENKDLKTSNSDLAEKVSTLEDENEKLRTQLSEVVELDCFNTSQDSRVIVNLPCTNQPISSEFDLTGVAFGIFENTLNYSLETTDGKVLNEGFTSVAATDLGLPGEFSVQVKWSPEANSETNLVLHVFETSAQDGSRIHEVEIPVVLKLD